MKKLQVLQAIASKNFRQDLVQKLRRQKNKASYIKDKFGLGPGSTVSTTTHPPKLDKIGKSKSVALPSPVKEESILGKILRPFIFWNSSVVHDLHFSKLRSFQASLSCRQLIMAWKVPYFAQMKIMHNTDLIQMDFRTEKNKIESTPILKLAMVKRL